MTTYKSKIVEEASKDFLCGLLLDENQPILERFRAVGVSSLCGSPGVLDTFVKAMRDNSSILGHEAAKKLGRMQDSDAIPALQAVLGCRISWY
ncbi:deoxyhypusine hydroxylase-like isoform X2 [Olea europaea var. sylvestris]|uniref:Deoxyhypusine hydroxylase-B n=1 Tax=Olea europaea subsp. europaea TaxID=158383 RepID=A0A8S0TGH7_OLEEU|nr:deoxyhypusine hydroxylase-like isoform X2 [Olea europaea var. sylvestris]CAA3002832.1 deoxyhypusine hydroxylase-B [Olea europaea subsp. europaea]